ncbi:MAG TPA: AAA family ATPase [Streptosporangiaceae bacterium]|nr:AAA family ATPase [Streptosporangiaceae bacterium]
MELKSVRIQNYRSIDDSGIVPIENITCLVGKNESGKTAFLHALHLLNPLNPIKGKTSFDDVMDFPSRRFSAYRKVREESPADVVTAVFELSESELAVIEEDLGSGVLSNREIAVVKGYSGYRKYRSEYVERRAIEHLNRGIEMAAVDKQAVEAATTIPDLMDALRAIPTPHPSVTDLINRIECWREQSLGLYLVDRYFEEWLPRFFYFSDYSTMRGRVSLPHLKAKEAAGLADEADRTFLSLLRTANADLSDFDVVDFEALTRELEGVANGITEEAFTYWRQNPGLRVVIQMSPGNPGDGPPLDRGPVLNLRIYNPKHAVTVPFDERSRGFVWFFSFYAYFSNIAQDPQRSTVLLLDEPGLSLHASAQGDVLAFIERKLAPKHRVIYTTHSPFLIDPQRIGRVRTVQDLDEHGTTVSSDAYQTDSETVFPLHAALNYELAQTLVAGQHCLLVERPSDLLYLQLLSQACQDAGLCALDPRWVVTPVGGADKVAAFVSLHGSSELNVAVLIDAGPSDQRRIKALQGNGHLQAKSLIQVSDFTTSKEADIEDLFDPAFYCAMISGLYARDLPAGTLKPADLKSRLPRITARVDQYLKDHDVACGMVNRYQLSAYFLREQQTLLPALNTATLKRAAKLFERINSCLT